jgi:multisubunit Na+/H+ antiporter MnhB subunit
MIASSGYRHFPYRSHEKILQKEVNQGRDLTMAAVVIALVLFVALPVLSLRYGVDSRMPNAWSPGSDWRERDPRS